MTIKKRHKSRAVFKDKPSGCVVFSVRLCCCLVLSILAFFVWVTSLQPVYSAFWASNWAKTPCVILDSNVSTSSSIEYGDFACRPKVKFQYAFANELYVSERFDFSKLNRSKSRCKDILQSYSVDQQAFCFVDPQDPTAAVLERGYRFSWLVFLFPLVFVGCLGALVFWPGLLTRTLEDAQWED